MWGREMYPSSVSWDIAFRTVAGLTLTGDRRAISSEATGMAVLMYSFTNIFRTVPARSDIIGHLRTDVAILAFFRYSTDLKTPEILTRP
jgi:hypothetical protein